MPRIDPADRERIASFLSAVEALTVTDWEVICRRRAGRRPQIRKADGEAQHVMLEMMRARGFKKETKAVEAQNVALNERARRIVETMPEQGPDIGGSTAFRKLVHIALFQALAVLRTYSECQKTPEGSRAAAELLLAFDGIVQIP